MEIRFHSPYRHALSGLLTELALFALYLLITIGLALLAAWMR